MYTSKRENTGHDVQYLNKTELLCCITLKWVCQKETQNGIDSAKHSVYVYADVCVCWGGGDYVGVARASSISSASAARPLSLSIYSRTPHE